MLSKKDETWEDLTGINSIQSLKDRMIFDKALEDVVDCNPFVTEDIFQGNQNVGQVKCLFRILGDEQLR